MLPLSQLLSLVFDSKKITKYVIFAGLPFLLFYGVSLATMLANDFSVIEILRDPAQISGQNSFFGFLSNIGAWLWVSSTAICFATVMANQHQTTHKYRELLILMGTFALLLGVDDFFMIHDRYMSQNKLYLVYALLAGSLMLRHLENIVKVDGFSFLLGGFFLGMSIFFDLIQRYIPMTYEQSQIIEEGFKFMGAATWLYFNFRVAQFYSKETVRAQLA